MRVTSNRMMDLSSVAVSRNQARVAELSEEVSSGRRVNDPTDDPAAWMQAQRANARKALSDGATAVLDRARDRLDQSDGALASFSDVVSRIQTLALQGASDTYNPGDRAELAGQMEALFGAALGFANTQAPDGEYLFAGSRSLTAPFDAAGVYVGDAGERDVPTDADTVVGETLSGAAFTAAGGVDVLPALARAAAAFRANNPAAIQTSLGELNTAVGQMSSLRTRMGVKMSVVDDTRTAHVDLSQRLATEAARLVEGDTIESASALARASQALEVSRAVSANIAAVLKSAVG